MAKAASMPSAIPRVAMPAYGVRSTLRLSVAVETIRVRSVRRPRRVARPACAALGHLRGERGALLRQRRAHLVAGGDVLDHALQSLVRAARGRSPAPAAGRGRGWRSRRRRTRCVVSCSSAVTTTASTSTVSASSSATRSTTWFSISERTTASGTVLASSRSIARSHLGRAQDVVEQPFQPRPRAAARIAAPSAARRPMPGRPLGGAQRDARDLERDVADRHVRQSAIMPIPSLTRGRNARCSSGPSWMTSAEPRGSPRHTPAAGERLGDDGAVVGAEVLEPLVFRVSSRSVIYVRGAEQRVRDWPRWRSGPPRALAVGDADRHLQRLGDVGLADSRRSRPSARARRSGRRRARR